MTVKHRFEILTIILATVLSYGMAAALMKPVDLAMEKTASAEPLPEVTFYDAALGKHSLSDFKGQVVLVNLWATWCPPCVVELPALDNLQAKLKDKNFKVIAISVDRTSVESVAKFLAEHGVENLDPYWDQDREVPKKWVYAGIPASFLIDGDGRVIQKFDGAYKWDEGAIFDKIKSVLK